MAIASRIGFWSIPLDRYPNSNICISDALAPPLCSLKPRQIARSSHQFLQPDQGDSPLESLVQHERLGCDSQDTAKSKDHELIKFCATVASVWLAPLVSSCNCLPQLSCCTWQNCLDQLAATGQWMATCSACSMYCCVDVPMHGVHADYWFSSAREEYPTWKAKAKTPHRPSYTVVQARVLEVWALVT